MKTPIYQVFDLPHSKVHTLRIPSQIPIQLAVSPNLETLDQFAQKYQADAVINAGFFDPKNEKTTAYLTVNGQLVGKPEDNPNLIDNPKLKPYLAKILNRSEFRRYQCGQQIKYAIAFHQDPIPTNCQLINAVGGGPSLLPNSTATTEAFWQEEKGQIIRDGIGLKQRNARTAIALFPDGDVLLVMAAQKPEKLPKSGLSLPELTDFLKSQGVTNAMNLDGGSSSAFHYQNKTYNGKFDQQGKPILRGVKSVLWFK
ncbi:MAG: phosphodiester glycosidase family protein [Microcystaceae cyanobacterium]